MSAGKEESEKTSDTKDFFFLNENEYGQKSNAKKEQKEKQSQPLCLLCPL